MQNDYITQLTNDDISQLNGWARPAVKAAFGKT